MVQHEPASSSPTSGRQRTISGRQPLNDRRPNTAPIASANTNGVRPKSRGFDSNTGEFANDENLPVDDDEAVDVFEDAVHDDDFGDDNSIDNSVDNSIPDNASEEPEDEPQDEPEEEASPAQAASQRNNKRPATDADIPSPESHPESDTKTNPKRKRGGRPKGQSTEEKEVARPAKKAKTQPLDPELAKVVETHVNRTGPLKGRSLYILKREEAPNAAAHTRSGRVSVRPLAYWRNERCVYGDGEADVGQRYPLSTIKEIIRTEELLPEKGPKAKKRKTGKTGKKSKHDDSSDDEADERDDWEKDDGVLHGYVKSWDSEQQVSADGEEVLGMSLTLPVFSPTSLCSYLQPPVCLYLHGSLTR
jgi:centromere protein C